MLNIKQLVRNYHSSARSFAELVPYLAMWDEETVVTLDQGMLGLWRYEGLDAEGRTSDEVGLAAQRFQDAFAGFGTGNTLWSLVDRRRDHSYPGGKFTDPVARMIDDRWQTQVAGSQYVNKYTLALHQRTEGGVPGFFDAVDLIAKEEGVGLTSAAIKAVRANLSLHARQSLDERRMKTAHNGLRERAQTMESALRPLGLKRLTGEKLLAELFNRCSPASPARERLDIPHVPAFLNALLPADLMQRTSDALVFRNAKEKFVGVVSLKGFSGDASTHVGQLDWLTTIDGEVTLAHCFRFLDRDTAQKAIESVERYNMSKAIPFGHRLMSMVAKQEPTKFNEGRLALAQDAKAAQINLVRDNIAFGHHNLTVLCYGDTLDEMNAVRAQVLENLRASRFIGHAERMHQLSAFTQTMPGQWAGTVRWNFVSFANVADIAPIRTLTKGDDACAHFSKELGKTTPVLTCVPTDAGTPVNIDLWERGVGHLKIIGPTRTGKSILTNFLLSQFRKYEPCRTIVIDKDYSCWIPTLMQGGMHIDLSQSKGKRFKLAPMALLGDPVHHPFLVGWLAEIITNGRQGVSCTPAEIDKITGTVRGLAVLKREHWTLSYAKTSLGPDLGAYLSRWVNGGADGNWFDNEAEELNFGRHLCFECKELFDDPEVAQLAMSYLFHVIEHLLDDTPTIVSIEETWFFLDNEVFARKIDGFLRTLGKRNGSLWMVTQNLKEIDQSSIRSSILSNVPNTIYLPDASLHQSAALYQDVGGLQPEEITRIASAHDKQNYYLKTPSRNRMLSMFLPPEIVAVLTSGARARKIFERHYNDSETNPSWRGDYLKEVLAES